MRRSERGAIFIQVAISLLVLLVLTTFVLDYGIFWLARGEAQNAADAGALAGAVARGFDDTGDSPSLGTMGEGGPSGGGAAYQSAARAALANRVMGAEPWVDVSWECPDWSGLGSDPHCVRVDVYRDLGHDNALPTVFGFLIGQTSQDIKATATALVAPANATDCLRPWAISDKWVEQRPAAAAWDSTATYDHYYTTGKNAGTPLPDPIDVYVAPTETSTGTGFTLANDLGAQITLKFGNGRSDISPGWYLPIDLPRAGEPAVGGDRYRENIESCNGLPVAIGQYLPTETGAKMGPTLQGVGVLIAKDPAATWVPAADGVAAHVENSAFGVSPRIVPLPVFDPDRYQLSEGNNDWSMCPGGGSCVRVVNILGFFVDRVEGNDVIGYLAALPGDIATGGSGVPPPASFLTTIRLIR